MRVRKFRRLTWMSAAAVAAVLCVSVTLAVMLGKKEPTPERFISLSSPYGAKVEAELPDGSHVWLNSNTRLEYPEAFDGDRRRVSLDGEAYFEVHADKASFCGQGRRYGGMCNRYCFQCQFLWREISECDACHGCG
ncbi:FecR domain-containing protein [Bacteroides sp. f07]|uniref:FecR domain-containing protein n=1 Tax=Bacteroides sp. f07 TaxID=3132704 RepID=UPI0036F1CD42